MLEGNSDFIPKIDGLRQSPKCSKQPLCNVGNLVLTTELKRKLATVKGKKADVSSVCPSSERLCVK